MNTATLSTGPASEAEQTFTGVQAVVIGADEPLALAFASQRMENDLPIRVDMAGAGWDGHGEGESLPARLAGAQIAILASGTLPAHVASQCQGLLHVIFLSEEAYQACDREALERLGITPHAARAPLPAAPQALADAAIEQCRRIVSPTGG